jgi:molybdopterin converting factor small subunit
MKVFEIKIYFFNFLVPLINTMGKSESSIQIKIKLFFDLAEYLPPGSKNRTTYISLDDGTTVQGLLEVLGLPPQMPKSILVNGVRADSETELQESDSVAIFPPMAGG